jgi:hypothetical protein
MADVGVIEVSSRTRATVSESEIAVRRRVLGRLGIETTDDPTRGKCPGALIPPAPPNEPERSKRVLCPNRPQAVAAVALERRGGAYLEVAGIDERAISAEFEAWSTRVLLTRLTPDGASTTVFDFVARRHDGRWTLVKRVPLMVID